MTQNRPLITALLLCWATLASAADYVVSEGKLSDDNFYNIIACAAAPNTPCEKPIVRWPDAIARDLTIAITEVRSGFPAETQSLVNRALDASIAEINGAGSGLSLRRLPDGEDAHITLYLWDQKIGERLKNTGLSPVDGTRIGAAHFRVWWNRDKEITRGLIIVARDIDPRDVPSIMLEEIVQATGLMTDIENDWYVTRSIFSEIGSDVISLRGQDVTVLRRHYPPQQ